MGIMRGSVAKSLAGRDKGSVQVVIGMDGRNVFVCDGKKRKLEFPKKKNTIHLQFTKNILSEEQLTSNKAICKALKDYS